MSPLRCLALSLAAAIVAAAPAGARTPPPLQIGMGDQHARMFDEPLFRKLHMRYARLVVRWDVATLSRAARQPTADWIAGARRAHVQPHIAFTNAHYTRRNLAAAPSARQYRRGIAAFRRRWPGVRVFTPWNEVNLTYQQTSKRPGLAAAYYRILRRACPGCQVVAADLLDTGNAVSWLRAFLRHVRGAPRLWGLHNYRDANYGNPLRRSWTLRLTRMVRGAIWVTESGGIVGMRSSRSGRLRWAYDPRRAARSLRHLLALVQARSVRARYRRLYVYSFFGAWSRTRRTNPWDSGVIGLDGRPRPSYAVLQQALRRSARL